MSEIFASVMLMVVLLVLLSGGVWVGLTLAGVAWFGMAFFTARAAAASGVDVPSQLASGG